MNRAFCCCFLIFLPLIVDTSQSRTQLKTVQGGSAPKTGSEKDELKEIMENFNAQMSRLAMKLETTIAELSNTKETLNSTQEELSSMKEEFNNTKQELKSTKEELADLQQRNQGIQDRMVADNKALNEILVSRIVQYEINILEVIDRVIPFKIPLSKEMSNMLTRFRWFDALPILSDQFGKYETIDSITVGKVLNWNDNWMRMKKSMLAGLAFPPLILPMEYGECVLVMGIVWNRKDQFELWAKIPTQAADYIPILPVAISIDARISVSFNGQIIKRERKTFQIKQSDREGTTLFAITDVIKEDWNPPAVDIQLFPPSKIAL